MFILGPRAVLIYAGMPRSEDGDDAILCRLEFHVYVVVPFYLWFKIYFPLFWGMIIYDNEFKTKGNKI